ncbi:MULTISPECIES: hypothetical protein [unclassified Rhodococcus (in: high G+C Gram-positive bacteria)]|uniref:hypothetical protein n=2 Tax=Mycobacteriales TaxID=85007 RepID=UPI0020CE8174|nr:MULTISPECIES: hypothetical protein [unclassified Rhodococcus (in: high G+C Gram-positive bacteria)]
MGAETAVAMYIPEINHDAPVVDPKCVTMATIATAIIEEFNGCKTLAAEAETLTFAGTFAPTALSVRFIE